TNTSLPWSLEDLVALAEQRNPQVVCLRKEVASLQATVNCLCCQVQACEKQVLHKHRCDKLSADLEQARNRLQQATNALEELLKDIRLAIRSRYRRLQDVEAIVSELGKIQVTTKKHMDNSLPEYEKGVLAVEGALVRIDRHYELVERTQK